MRGLMIAAALVLAGPASGEISTYGAVIVDYDEQGYAIASNLVDGPNCPMAGPQGYTGTLVYSCENEVENLSIIHDCDDEFLFLPSGEVRGQITFDGFKPRGIRFMSNGNRLTYKETFVLPEIKTLLRGSHYTTFAFNLPNGGRTDLVFNTYGFDRAISSFEGCKGSGIAPPWFTKPD
jgi:hypothetical protein